MGRILRPTPCPFHHNIALGSGTESTSGVCRGFENCAVEGPNPCAACYYVSGLFDVRHHEQLLPGERTGTTWQVIPVRSRGGGRPARGEVYKVAELAQRTPACLGAVHPSHKVAQSGSKHTHLCILPVPTSPTKIPQNQPVMSE